MVELVPRTTLSAGRVRTGLTQHHIGCWAPKPSVVWGKILGPQGIEGLAHHAPFVVRGESLSEHQN